MKNILIYIAFLSVVSMSYGQTQLFQEYNFEDGGYYILGTFSESDSNSLCDSLGEFYTNDLSVLNKFKQEWVFTKPGKKQACGYHYSIYICRNGNALEQFFINLNCNEIVSDKGYFYFDSEKLRQFYGQLHSPRRKRERFDYLEVARMYRSNILKDKNLIMTPTPDWVIYEGAFQFEYECKEGSSSCDYENRARTLTQIESTLRKEYTDEIFELDYRGGSSQTIRIEVKCNKTLSDEFDLFKRDPDSYFGTFTPFSWSLTSYWKR